MFDKFKRVETTLILILINIISFILFYFLPSKYFHSLVLNKYRVIYELEFWRIFTSLFLHDNILHLFVNIFLLLIFGIISEQIYQSRLILVIYLLSGIVGNIFSLILLPVNTISLGASGAIFGLIGLTIILNKNVRFNRSLWVFRFLCLILFIFSFLIPNINFFSHFFGALVGILFGNFYKLNKKQLK